MIPILRQIGACRTKQQLPGCVGCKVLLVQKQSAVGFEGKPLLENISVAFISFIKCRVYVGAQTEQGNLGQTRGLFVDMAKRAFKNQSLANQMRKKNMTLVFVGGPHDLKSNQRGTTYQRTSLYAVRLELAETLRENGLHKTVLGAQVTRLRR